MNVTNPRKSTDTAEQQPQQQQQQPVISYVSCRQAATTTAATNNLHKSIEEQDQVVSSTSSECLLVPVGEAEGEGEEVALELDALITSPARISSSTVGYEVRTNTAYVNDGVINLDEVMPSTSQNSINALAARSGAETGATSRILQHSINTSSSSSSSSSSGSGSRITKFNEMMMRDAASTSITAEGVNGSGIQTAPTRKASGDCNENHKIILKLSKTTTEASNKSGDISTVNTVSEDLRKVEPLKINLLGTHVHTSPKITIKPIVKTSTQGDITGSSEECSSSAEDEIDLRRNASVHEPHILPKLTIRAVNEERGTSITSIVPKLTIKMNDSSSASAMENATGGGGSSGNVTLCGSSGAQQTTATLPLPKLTIKTGSDGHSESIITNISPASSTSSSTSHCFSSSSSSSSSSSTSLTKSAGTSANSATAHCIPKLTIKPLPKIMEKESTHLARDGCGMTATVPKLTIKASNMGTAEMVSSAEVSEEGQTAAKIPKLTIKTGQEHAVIITQHNDSVGSPGIPKLTIKTKSLDGGEDASSSIIDGNADHNEKIPKITIKTSNTQNNTDTPPAIPKLTINVAQLDNKSSGSGNHLPSSPKQVVPKLTITRQQTDMIITSHQKVTSNAESGGKNDLVEGVVPKMTIKTQKKSLSIVRPNTPAYVDEECDKGGQTSEVVDKEIHVNIKHSKVVPKLTIKNLGSPKLTMMVVRDMVGSEQQRDQVHGGRTTTVTYTSNETLPPRELEEFDDLIHVANGGESNSSQEFCGFSDNLSQPNNTVLTNSDGGPQTVEETRRNSDDMDIDDALQQQHDPQVFNNLEHFTEENEPCMDMANGSSCSNPSTHMPISLMTHIIDTVDLTSSPSPSNSPAHFNYNEESNQSMGDSVNRTAQPQLQMPAIGTKPSTNILLECLQREHSAPTCSYQSILYDHQKQQQQQQQIVLPMSQSIPANGKSSASFKYPQLAERLLANGTTNTNHLNLLDHPNLSSNTYGTSNSLMPSHHIGPEDTNNINLSEKIIDSIEILDSPEGSPHTRYDERLEDLKHTSPNESSLHRNTLLNGMRYHHHVTNHAAMEMLQCNNNNTIRGCPSYVNNVNLKRTAAAAMLDNQAELGDLKMSPTKLHCIESDNNTMATVTFLTSNNNTSPTAITTSPTRIHNNTAIHGHAMDATTTLVKNNFTSAASSPQQSPPKTSQNVTLGSNSTHQRSRKQRHEHLLPMPIDEMEPMQLNSKYEAVDVSAENINDCINVQNKRRGRPKKASNGEQKTDTHTSTNQSQALPSTVSAAEYASKSRRVQLLRKRLAIDMVAAEQPLPIIDEQLEIARTAEINDERPECDESEKHRKEQRALRTPVRTSRRSNTPTQKLAGNSLTYPPAIDQIPKNSTMMTENLRNNQYPGVNETTLLNHFSSSNSDMSSMLCTSSIANTSTSNTSTSCTNAKINASKLSTVCMSTQIDLTMSSSSSSASNCSTTATTTIAEAGTSLQFQHSNANSGSTGSSCIGVAGINGSVLSSSSNNSMLPPTTILSSSNPLPDVVFKPNDFSSIIVTQQLRAPLFPTNDIKTTDGQLSEPDGTRELSGADDSPRSLSMLQGRGRGRGRGRGGGRGGRGNRGHRLSRGGALNATITSRGGHTKHDQLEHSQGLFSPSPQVFEEDTRMSADLNQIQSSLTSQELSTLRQPEFLANEESQSSMVSTNSALDPNTGPSNTASNASSTVKKPKKKKMEVCVAEDTEISVAALAKYDWPPAKGCCPSKHRENFMIQEQVALYLGIKSFKRKYPDLARRQIDIEERNWLQEKGLVSEKMCDLGITAVLASDILDIMVTDFYDKYEEYMDYERQKHFREKDAKNKALGFNVSTKGLQAKERAMLSASKWNSYLNKTRREERLNCLDLQTFTINKPLPMNAALTSLVNRPMAESVDAAAKAAQLTRPPTLLRPLSSLNPPTLRDSYYPLSLVPGQFCEKYNIYTAQELRQLPLKTALDHSARWWPKSIEENTNSTDTDSAAETALDTSTAAPAATTSQEMNKSYTERFRRRRSRRARGKLNQNNKDFKLPALPGDNTKTVPGTCTESSSSSEGSSSESESCSSSSESSSSCTDNSEDDYSCSNNCGVCQRPQNSNLKNMPELFIQCYTCRRKVHPSCIEMPHRMAVRVRNYNWQCANCKCCIKCKRHRDQNKMLFCEQCDRGYHIYCLNIKAVPDCRWSCERCSICMRCGATKPEGLASAQQQVIVSPTGEKQLKQIKHKKVKWINEYRIDHITKLREHCSMLCVPCGRMKIVKRVQIAVTTTSTTTLNTSSVTHANSNSNNNNNSCSSGSSNGTLHNISTASNATSFQPSSTKTANGLTNTHTAAAITSTATTEIFNSSTSSSSTSSISSSSSSSANNMKQTVIKAMVASTGVDANGAAPPVVA